MAQIVLSGEELVGIVQANGWMPREVAVVGVNGREIELKVNTPLPLFRSVRISAQFAGYEHGRIILELATNRLMDSLSGVIGKMLESLHLEDHGGRWEYPRLYVEVNSLIQRRLRGVEVESIVFRDDRFHIHTATGTSSAKAVAGEHNSPEAPRSFIS
jgi:hypothetical protein